MRSLSLSYLLAAVGFAGVAGLHRFYLGKPITGLIWFLTGGLGGLGTIYDLLTMESQVQQANRYRLPVGHPQAMLPPQQQRAYPGPSAAPIDDMRDPSVDLELRILKLARMHKGRLTTPLTASELGVPMADADKKLSDIAAAGHANVEVTDDGAVVFDFPSLRVD